MRALICGFLNFPRGGAASNYVLYYSKVLQSIGYEVIVISNKNHEYDGDTFEQIQIEEISIPNNKFKKFCTYNIWTEKAFVNQLKKYSLVNNDIIISYSRDSKLIGGLLKYARRNGCKMAAIVVEHFAKEDYKYGIFDLNFWKEKKSLNSIIPKADYVFPISTEIEKYLSKKNANCMTVPIMMDVEQVAYKESGDNQIRRFIYTGNGKMKDRIDSAILALKELSSEEICKLEFHIKGVTEQYVRNLLVDDPKKYNVIIHGWMKYAELQELYTHMDFIMIPRQKSQMTISNFPSKVPEALSFGIIPVVSDVGDYTKYYLQDGVNSIIFEGCEVNQCLTAVRKCLAIDQSVLKQMKKAARECAVNRFDYRNWEKTIKNFLES